MLPIAIIHRAPSILPRQYRSLLLNKAPPGKRHPASISTRLCPPFLRLTIAILHPTAPDSIRDTDATAVQLRNPFSAMVVELRKRKEAPPAPVRPAKKTTAAKGKKAESDKTVVEKVQETVAETVDTVKKTVTGKANGKAAESAKKTGGPAKVGDTVDLATFGGEIETNDGNKTTLAKLVEESKAGVVLFTYPKASTPGCEYIIYFLAACVLTCARRHHTSLPLPRLICSPYSNWLQHLRPLQRQPKGKHHLQDKAEASLYTSVRSCTDTYLCYWAEEGTQGNNSWCIRHRQVRQGACI